MCAIIKGVYLMQLRQQDFYYNGKDVIIWTVVETATAIIAASIPVLRVFFKEAVSSYNNTHGGATNTQASTKTVPLSNLGRSRHSGLQSIGKGREAGWTTLGPIEDGNEDRFSQRGLLKDEEHGGILQKNTVTVTVNGNSKL
jgi:hypothetical protein